MGAMKRCISLRSIRSPIFNKNKRYPRLTVPILRTNTFQTRPFTNTTTKMSFSNADTGSKNADPYKATNKDETSIQEKVEDLSEFVKACKFGMMTTRDGSSGALVSRSWHWLLKKPVALTSSSTPTPNPARPTTSTPTLTSTSPSLTAQANGPPSPAKPPSSPTVTPSRNTTRPLSKPGSATSVTESTMVPRTILESVLSELRL